MTDEERSRVLELKATIAATATTPSGAPREVRETVVVLKKRLRRSGTTARALALMLGVHETTLCRWEREARDGGGRSGRGRQRTPSRRASGFRAVEVVASPAPMTSALASAPPAKRGRSASLRTVTASARPTVLSVPPPRGLRVAHAPSGLVVEGLDVETLAALLRRLS
jgi:transposase-like protein